jgi:hypothetical protein
MTLREIKDTVLSDEAEHRWIHESHADVRHVMIWQQRANEYEQDKPAAPMHVVMICR